MGNCYEPTVNKNEQILFQRRKSLSTIESYSKWHTLVNESPALCLSHLNLFEKDVIAAGFSNSTIRVWDAYSKDENKLHLEITSHFSSVTSITTLQLDEKTILLVSADDMGYIHTYDLKLVEPLVNRRQAHEGAVKSVISMKLFIKNEPVIVSGGLDGKIKIWSSNLKEELITLPGHENGVFCLNSCDFNGTNYIISGGFDRIINLWNPLDANNKLINSFTGHESYILCVTSLILNGKEVIVSGSNDNKIKVWNALCSEKLLKAWNPIGKENKKLLMTLFGHHDAVTSLISVKWNEFERNKEFIVSGSLDGTVKIWDPAADLREICSIKVYFGPIYCLTDYVYMNEIAIVSGGDKEVIIWKKVD